MQTLYLVPNYVAGRIAAKIDRPTVVGEGQQAEAFLPHYMVQKRLQVKTS
jgi:hypothetical protein